MAAAEDERRLPDRQVPLPLAPPAGGVVGMGAEAGGGVPAAAGAQGGSRGGLEVQVPAQCRGGVSILREKWCNAS